MAYAHPCLSSNLVSILIPLDLVIDMIWFRPESDALSLEEVVESLVPPPVSTALTGGDMVAEQEAVEQEWAVDSVEAQILAARVAAAMDRREISPPTSNLSTGKMNPRAPEWNKRLKIVLLHRAEHRAQTMSKAKCYKTCANALTGLKYLVSKLNISSWMCSRAVVRFERQRAFISFGSTVISSLAWYMKWEFALIQGV
ncbi:uncharacterized protein LOC125546790 [Triticum urartu]|uniref:uncharacterized protein LOC125546790 n=1 Tax=Triticum urartu TaxID=4572 RepID=UPI0020434205|nr:uncharacterized protein LOC125546790 [Triticum urartu]